ncbi:hypothetical protein [Crocosphaera sp. XPORK-15E]|uniref:hypothetical protein n=1 Tax=Crocosphaera sp. XPORK-15E TaxID=3110247 RepID=UPI002B20A16F|nr:hypothetical protein [Crocosphaera sp. XPORK-15E]MEA5535077.1 hypothetical protein [Crocosphaera sp. XPORK-15E]
MKKISIDELEQKIEAGEEVIDHYFDASTTREGKVYKQVSRRKQPEVIDQSKVTASEVKEELSNMNYPNMRYCELEELILSLNFINLSTEGNQKVFEHPSGALIILPDYSVRSPIL